MKFIDSIKPFINFSGASRRGQILIPSLLVIPTLLIFVYLLFETTKLSREKIRQQFAIDSAVFIQMGDYTNLFNRTAYINGVYPYRIFKEEYGCEEETNYKASTHSGTKQKCMFEMLYESGAIPKDKDDTNYEKNTFTDDYLSDASVWPIEYKSDISDGRNKRTRESYSKPFASANDEEELWITIEDHAAYYWISWDLMTAVYQFYTLVYNTLSSVEEAQWTVFERLTNDSSFFRKSYYFNAATPECINNPKSCAGDGVSYFQRAKITSLLRQRIKKIGFFARMPGDAGVQRYGHTEPPMDQDGGGLFQAAGFDPSKLKQIGDGIDVYQGWTAPPNYFNVNFNSISACRELGKPCVHAKIASQCPKSNSPDAGYNNCVWPYPTPKYQTRLYP